MNLLTGVVTVVCLLTVASGQAVISLLEPLSVVVHRPGQFSLNVHKTGSSSSLVTVIVEVSLLFC